MISEFPNSYELQFSSCGTYLATYEYSNCDLDSVIFLIDDSSMTSYQLEGNNEFAYGNVGCPSGGSSCDHVISIAGGSSLEDPLWDICKTFSCSFSHIIATEFPENNLDCILDSILYENISGFSQSDSCWTLNQDEFVTVDSVSGEIISNDFFNFVDSLGNILFDLGACPTESSCSFADSTCVDSITIDTFLVPFPIHVGGQWTIIENGDTIICADTTAFTKNGIDLLLLIEPGAEYFGPDQITFSLLQIVGQDTVPVTQELSLTAWWKENFIYDTLEIIDSQVHYSEDPHCQSCGGTSFFSDYGSIPGPPDQPCSPISLSFGDPCACGNFDAIITGNSLLDCNEPCTTLSAEITAGNWSDPTWSLNGSIIGIGEDVFAFDDEMEFLWSGPNGFFENSPIIEVCEPGLYELVVLLNG